MRVDGRDLASFRVGITMDTVGREEVAGEADDEEDRRWAISAAISALPASASSSRWQMRSRWLS